MSRSRPAADAGAKYADGDTPLTFAAESDNSDCLDVVQTLVAHGAKIDVKAKDGTTPLYHACSKGTYRVARYLISKGADVNARETTHGFTPLDAVASREARSAAQKLANRVLAVELINSGADLGAKDDHGKTPLDLARQASGRDEEVVNLLASAAVGPATRPDRATPVAATQGTAKVRIAIHPPLATQLIDACAAGDADLALELVLDGADVKARDGAGATALYHAAGRGEDFSGVVKALVEHGAEVDATRHDGTTPLFNACARGTSHLIVSYLLSHGADVNVREKASGSTPLHAIASRAAPPGDARSAAAFANSLVAFGLIVHGANQTAEDADGKIPLERARQVKPPDQRMIEMLVRTLGYPPALSPKSR